MGIRGTKTWDDLQSWLAAAGTVSAGSYTAAGQWTFGPGNTAITHQFNGTQVLVNGGSAAASVELRVNAATGQAPFLRFAVGGASKGLIGASGATNNLVTGSAVDDLVIRAPSANILFSGDDGTSVHGKVTSTGLWTFGPINAGSIDHIVNGRMVFDNTLGPYLSMRRSGVDKAFLGISPSASGIITTSVQDDMVLRAQKILFSADISGGGKHGQIASTGSWTLGNTGSMTTPHEIYGPSYAGVSTALFTAEAASGAGAGYKFFVGVDGTSLKLGHNSGSRNIDFVINSVVVQNILAGGETTWGVVGNANSHLMRGGSNGVATQGNFPLRLQNLNASGAGPQGALIFLDGAGDTVGNIQMNASANSATYNSGSDARLKHSPQDFDGMALLMAMEPKKYERYSNPGVEEIGLYAQELYEVYPQAVGEGGEDPRTEPWCIDYGKLTPVLIKALQELKQQFDDYVAAHP